MVTGIIAGAVARGTIAVSMMAAVSLAGCGTVYLSGSNHRSAVLMRENKVRQPDPAGTVFGYRYETGEQQLQAAAFTLLRGRTGVEAVAFLRDDGWDCTGLLCTTWRAEQEFGYLGGIRAPGPARRYIATYRLTLPERTITTLGDIEAGLTSRSEEV